MEKKISDEKLWKRHKTVWAVVWRLLKPYICRRFNLDAKEANPPGPCIVIPNHVSNWDPLLVAMSFPKKQMYFVASEHLFRLGFVSRLITYFLAPIPRRKASMGSDTVMAVLRHVRAGHSICIFAEGEATWNGVSNPVFSATGKMVKNSGASLVTYKLEGGYLSDPRWGKKTRRGRTRGYVMRVYSPEELKELTPQQVNDIINRDLYEDAWERQRFEKRNFKGKDLAVGMERGLFLCPKCRKIGRLHSEGDRVHCDCGFSLRYTEKGFFEPNQPFEHFGQWDAWQHEALKNGDFVHNGEELFHDNAVKLTKVEAEHQERLIGQGRLSMTAETLDFENQSFPLADISHMDMVNTHRLLFKRDQDYFELEAVNGNCMRKYLAVWKNLER